MWPFIKDNPFIVVLAYVLITSVITFFIYRSDKMRAIKQMRRISEKTLLVMSIIGGAFGGFAAMQLFRHKTRGEHWYFAAVNLIGMLLHAAAVILIVIFF